MKRILLSLLFLIGIFSAPAQVGINNTDPDPSAALDITSTDGGILIPRMTQAQRDAIVSPATGLMIFQTDLNSGLYYFEDTWKPFMGDTKWAASGENIYNANDGNVGVGTTSPTAKLHVQAQGGTPTTLLNQGFESNMTGFSVTGGNNKKWTRIPNSPYHSAHIGNYCMRTGPQMSLGNTTALTYNVTIPVGGGVISFYYMMKDTYSPENALKFYVNGIEQGSWTSDSGWTRASFSLPAGTYPVTWEYTKGGSSGSELPFAFIDDVLIETAVDGAFRLVDGSEGLGKILISDASGNASWQELNNEVIVDIPLIAAFGGMVIPPCNGASVGGGGSFSLTIKGVLTEVSYVVLERITSAGSTATIDGNVVLVAPFNAERLQVRYDFNPPLPFSPNGLIFSANNSSGHPDTFSLNYAAKSQSSITMNITRNDKFGDTNANCWQGEFFFDVFMTN